MDCLNTHRLCSRPYFDFTMSTLYVDSIIKRFNQKLVLSDIFLECKKGEIIGLLGKNGSGKSTLLQIVFGSIKAENRFVRVGERLVNSLSDAKGYVAYLPQHPFIPNHVKISRIISLFCDKENAAAVASYQLVQPLLKKKGHQLSGGEKRVLEILLIVHSDAPFILLDEPFNGVAPLYKEEIKKVLREQSQTKGLIITDHDYRNVLELATKVTLIQDGKTRSINQLEELKTWGYLPP